MIQKIKDFLAGKKTYLTALAAIVAVLISFANGQIEIVEAVKMIIEAILAMTIRAGVAKAEKK